MLQINLYSVYIAFQHLVNMVCVLWFKFVARESNCKYGEQKLLQLALSTNGDTTNSCQPGHLVWHSRRHDQDSSKSSWRCKFLYTVTEVLFRCSKSLMLTAYLRIIQLISYMYNNNKCLKFLRDCRKYRFYTILKFLMNFSLKIFKLAEMSKFPMNILFLLFLDFSACKSVGRYPANHRQFTRAPPRLTC